MSNFIEFFRMVFVVSDGICSDCRRVRNWRIYRCEGVEAKDKGKRISVF